MTSLAQNFLNPNNKPLVIGEFTIRQDEDGRYCLNDLHKASGDDKKHFPAYFLRNQQTKDLIAEIELSNINSSDSERYENLHIAVKVIKGGSDKQGTYVVKELVYAYAMWISPKFHLMVIRAYDSLVMEWLLNGKQTISPEQAGVLYNIVHTRANGNKNLIVQMWSRLKNHFKYSASYRELRAIHFEDAKHYLEVMDLNAKPEKHDSPDIVAQLDEYLKNINSRFPALKSPYAYEAAMKIADDMEYRNVNEPQSYFVSFRNGKVITRWLEGRFYPVDMIELSDIFEKFSAFARSNDLMDIGRNLKANATT
ncbi:KilA-N domain-containing protein [Acinetobacter pittii]|uniref:KilA-N domain-containing protein n=1 Tax=Acinetobacter pittii TaxID=48296 RepID=UPI0029546BA1|nr:KilA-N domain-containing protein [Acinetobacter pittii]MDV8150445.1 KilA-N domain-containing protein [Acinetobacter pittii]